MKKRLSFIIAIVLVLLCFTACGKKTSQEAIEKPSEQVQDILNSEETLASKIIQQQIPLEDAIEFFKELQLSYNDTDQSEWANSFEYTRANPYREITTKASYIRELQLAFLNGTLVIPSPEIEVIYVSNFTMTREGKFHILNNINSFNDSYAILRLDGKYCTMVSIGGQLTENLADPEYLADKAFVLGLQLQATKKLSNSLLNEYKETAQMFEKNKLVLKIHITVHVSFLIKKYILKMKLI